MDLKKMTDELRYELERLDKAILALEQLVLARGKQRGRPPKWAKEAITAPRQRAKRRTPDVA